MSQKLEWHQWAKRFPPNVPPFMLELWKWRNYDLIEAPEFERWETIRNAGLVVIPDLRTNYNPWFEECARAYAASSYIAAMGCGNSGKTWSFHTLAFLDYMSDPLHTQGIFTTTSQQGLDTRMWPILSGHFRAIRPAGWRIINNPRKMIMANRDDPKHTMRAVAIEERANKNMITDNIIGAHSDRIIWVVDEATSAPQAVFDAWSNLAGGTTHRRFVELGNPIDQLDTLGRFCRPVQGWDKLTVETDRWEFNFQGEKGIGLHFNGEKSPNLKFPVKANGASRWSFLFGHFDLQRHLSAKDENPLGYARFCQGWFADSSIVPKVMTFTHIEEAGSRGKTVFYGSGKNFASLDPAFGGDRATLKIWKMAECSETGKQVMEQIGNFIVPIKPGQIVGREIGQFVLAKRAIYKFDIIGIDTTTDNSAPAEWLKLNSEIKVLAVDFGGGASELPVSPTDPMLCKDRYVNMVTELWFTVRMILRQIRGLDEETCIELCSRYFDRVGKPEKLVVEPKRKMKERTHGKSPDLADNVAIACQVFRHLGGFDLPKGAGQSEGWKNLAKKKGQVYSSVHAYGT
jgi:hypothetical protein